MEVDPRAHDVLAARSNVSSDADARPNISVILCTYNRSEYLRTAITSLLDQGETDCPYELIIVDNGSTDETPEIARQLVDQGLIRYVHEPKLGLCHARNAGWRNARGVYVAYFDDDAIAEPGWINAIAAAFAFRPEPGVVGGRVSPIWEAERPAWLSDGVALSLTIVDWSPTPKYIPDVRVEWLVGANMAAPRHILEEVGGFDPRLDRVGANLLSGGDVFLTKQILALGYPCLYHPGMAIRHLAAKSRLNMRWFERRYYWQGISDAVVTLITDHPSLLSRLAYAWKTGLDLLARPRELAALAQPAAPDTSPVVFEQRCLNLIKVGYIAGLLGAARP